MKINDKERTVLEWLANEYSEDFGYYSFAPIVHHTKLTRAEVRRACRSLKRKGLTQFCVGLWSDNGPAGSGYAATKAGVEFIEAKS